MTIMNREFMIMCLLLVGFEEDFLDNLDDYQLYKLVHDYCFSD